jgi:hypothetical protein
MIAEVLLMFNEDENFAKGMVWAACLSIPLWLSFFGWIKMVSALLHL